MLGDQQVLDHRHFAEQPHMLESAHHAHAGNRLTRQPFQMAIAQFDGAASGAVEAGQAVKHRGFSRAVRADQRNNFAFVQLKRHVIHRQQAAETHRQPFNFQQRLRAHACSSLPAVFNFSCGRFIGSNP
ncbi:Uncharacterised protein [Serratia plymuthica]|uniref:Uncharacterized protein n=1 Tax=Serratia plymuthica TaxID=82996 RepID=A0A2X4TT97_SERPL|nr:Uncharacterised protein [Serratia plymuthica]